MKSSLLGTFVMLVTITTAIAQPVRQRLNPEIVQERMAAETDSVITHLGLEGETADTVRAVLTERNKKLMVLRTRMRGGVEDGGRPAISGFQELTKAIDEETNKVLATILTEEQMAAYMEYVESQRMVRRRRGLKRQ